MSLRSFLSQPRPMHRTLAVGLGALMLCFGIAFAIEHHFTQLFGPALLSVFGLTAIVAGSLLPESILQRLFTAALLLNIAAALFPVFSR